MAEVFGFCDERFAEVRDTLAKSIDADMDVGASYALTIDGELACHESRRRAFWYGRIHEAGRSL